MGLNIVSVILDLGLVLISSPIAVLFKFSTILWTITVFFMRNKPGWNTVEWIHKFIQVLGLFLL